MKLRSRLALAKTLQSRALQAIAALVFLSGILTIVSVLFAELPRRGGLLVSADAHVTLLTGLTFIYLASLLRRGKRSAWFAALPIYGYIVVRNFRHYVFDLPSTHFHPLPILLNLLVPFGALIGLIIYRNRFTVKSQVRNSALAARRALLVLLVAFLFGLAGFQLMDKPDFHQEISVTASAHYVVDQFGLTTDKQLVPYSRRAKLFLDSLAVVSLGSLFYVAVSFFNPIRFRLVHHDRDYQDMARLLGTYPGNSEDFFKLWPHDKAYFFTGGRRAGLAYRVTGGVALCAADPVGDPGSFPGLLADFADYCYLNDWEPAFIHTMQTHANIYKRHGFERQKIGEEAVVDLTHFITHVKPTKYFRHIMHKFDGQAYTTELLKPPHSPAVLHQLKQISDDWLKVPGRTERGFLMGYYTPDYLQQCQIMVARDSNKQLQAFINLLPVIDPEEANFDLLRHRQGSPGNINDFLLVGLIDHLHQKGFKRLNLGLCPLSGLDANGPESSGAVDSVLRFVYANGNRFYSFQGLRRFKAKYEPSWRSRFIVYKGGLAGFTRTLNALRRALRVRRVH